MAVPVGVPGMGPTGGSPRGMGTAGPPPPRPLSVPIVNISSRVRLLCLLTYANVDDCASLLDLAADVETLRRERDFFKQQMEYFKQQLSSQAGRAAPVVPGLGMAMDSDRASARGPLTRGSSDPSPPLEGEPSAAAVTRAEARAGEEVDMSSVLRERDTLQQERDFFRGQYNDLSRRMAQLTSTGPTISQTLRQEIDSLMTEKRNSNIARADLEGQVRILTERLAEAEREKAEIDGHTRDLHAAIEKLQDAATQRFPPSTQAFILEVRKARDAAMSDLEKVKKERDQLREKLRMINVYLSTSRRLLQQKVGEIGDTEHQLEMRLNQLSSSEARLKELEAEVVRVREELADSRAEVTALRASVARLDHDKDLLNLHVSVMQTELDTKTEGVASLREELRKREALVAQLEGSVTRLEGRLDQAKQV
ncbi:Centrosomal protein [Portunus trituberculatus]|uniref:Centrosomal protein n=1 Tax=Portunus trituberculatus TaxID=210409 RepID=A0A5B7F0S5_PORTR|nr:Centrosomal protein [Portunus trituberculatus]